QPLAAQVLRGVLPDTDVGQVVGEPAIAEHAAGHALEQALRSFDHRHVIGLAAGPVDARHHGGEKHAADALGIFTLFSAEITDEQCIHAWRVVPRERFEIIAHRVEFALTGADVDGLVHSVLADAPEPEVLKLFLHDADIDIGDRPGCEFVLAGERLQQHRRAQHFVVADTVGPYRAHANQRIGQDGQRSLAVADAILEPFALPLLHRYEPDDVAFVIHRSFSASIPC